MKLNDPLIEIIPFKEEHQVRINRLMQQIQQEFSELFSSPLSRSITELSQSPREYFWVALKGDKIIGTVGIAILKNHNAVLKRMFIAKNFRGRQLGLAESLLNIVIEKAEKHGIQRMYLGTMNQFKAAHKFYQKHGFVKVQQEDLPESFPLNPVDELHYICELKGGLL